MSNSLYTPTGNPTENSRAISSLVRTELDLIEDGFDAVEAADANIIHTNAAGEISGIASKVAPIGADVVVIEDSADSYNKKKVLLTNMPAGSGTDAGAVHVDQAGEIAAITEKTTVVNADLIIIEDSESAGVKKRVQVGNLPGGGLAWSIISTATSAESGNGYLIDAFSAAVTLTLPAEPDEGDIVGACDYNDSASSNVITIARNGSNIMSAADDLTIDVDGAGLTLVYTDATVGWKIVTEVSMGSLPQVLESDFNETTFLYATVDSTPEAKTPAEVRVILNVEDGSEANNISDVNAATLTDDSMADSLHRHSELSNPAGTVTALNVDATGQVGIGTASPSTPLHVNSADDDLATFQSTDAHAAIHLKDNSGTTELRTTGATFFIKPANGTNELAFAQTVAYPTVNGSIGLGGASNRFGTYYGTTGNFSGSIYLKDQAAAPAYTAGYGQIWVKNTTPDELWFTDDAGTDTQLSSHPTDAPPELYANGPGLDWIGKRVQNFLGIIFWQTLDGVITQETFEDYNLRRKDEPGHVDRVKRDWDAEHTNKQKALLLEENIFEEITIDEAFEFVEIKEKTQVGTKIESKYIIDDDDKIALKEKTVPIVEEQGTGQFKKQLKEGVSLDEKTGKFIRSRKRTQAEVDAMDLEVPPMPKWMIDAKAAIGTGSKTLEPVGINKEGV